MKLLNFVLSISVFATALLLLTPMASAVTSRSEQDRAWQFEHHPVTGLIKTVRDATARYRDVRNAVADGYGPVLGCVSGEQEGAMGVHYLNSGLIGDGTVDAAHPELLVYEPMAGGHLRLVAAEFITLADNWNTSHPDTPPLLMGQLFDYASSPNRFGLPANYSLHVWAWKYNPKGTFSMWNPRVSCDAYTSP